MDNSLLAVLFGIGGAIGWGASNYFAGSATKGANPLKVVFSSQFYLFLIMLIVDLIVRPNFHFGSRYIFILALSYLIFTLGLIISYKSYAEGPISITAPIVGANSLIVVASSVIIFGESLSKYQVFGLVLLFLGLFLVTAQKTKMKKLKLNGVSLALIAFLFIGIGLSGYVYAIGKIGWMPTVTLGYLFTALWSGLFLIYKNQIRFPKLINKDYGLLTAFQLIGTISVSYGVEHTKAAIVVPVSSLSPLVTASLGLYLLKEAISRKKLIGVAIIIVSLVLLALR